jgi:hypothetical protein
MGLDAPATCPAGSDFYIGRVGSWQQLEDNVVFTTSGGRDTGFHYMGNGNSWRLTGISNGGGRIWSIQGDPEKTVALEVEP